MAEQTPDSIITTQRNGQTIVAELFFNHSSTETFRDKLLKLVLADSSRLDDNISTAIWLCMGYTVLLCFTLFKTSSLAKSIFNSH